MDKAINPRFLSNDSFIHKISPLAAINQAIKLIEREIISGAIEGRISIELKSIENPRDFKI